MRTIRDPLFAPSCLIELNPSRFRGGTMKRALSAGVGLFVLAVAAQPVAAADLPARAPIVKAPVSAPALNWTGPYAGLFAGYGWGTANFGLGPFSGLGFDFITYNVSADGFFGGGQAGYNWAVGNYIWGIEGEVGYLGLKGNAIHPASIPFASDTSSSFKSDFYAAITGRAGVPLNGWLFYGKGGLALLNARTATIDTCSGGGCGGNVAFLSETELLLGWTIGGGAEWAPNERWSVKVEYMYMDFGNMLLSGVLGGGGPAIPQDVGTTVHTAKLGINYRFSTGVR